MHKTFQYRLYPTKKQQQTLETTLEECRWLYNHLLHLRKQAYEQTGKSLSCYEQIRSTPIEPRSSIRRSPCALARGVVMTRLCYTTTGLTPTISF